MIVSPVVVPSPVFVFVIILTPAPLVVVVVVVVVDVVDDVVLVRDDGTLLVVGRIVVIPLFERDVDAEVNVDFDTTVFVKFMVVVVVVVEGFS